MMYLAKMNSLVYSCLFASICVLAQYQTYQSTNVTNPILSITKSGEPLAPGYMFFIPETYPVNNFTPLIMTDDGELIWSSFPETSFNLHVSELHGQKVLSYWTGYLASIGYGYGEVKILDSTYTELYSICPKLGLHVPKFETPQPKVVCEGDIHESELTYDATLLVSAYNVTRANLTAIGGPDNAWTVDSQFHEIDIATGELLFSWSSLDHVPITATVIPYGFEGNYGNEDTDPFDFFHLNSAQKVAGGRYLVGSRHTSAVYYLDTDGTILWRFNGYNGGDFTLPKAPHNTSHFGYQHDSRIQSMKNNITLVHFFNNNNIDNEETEHQNSGMLYRLNTATMKSTLIRRYHDPNQELYANAQGSYGSLSNGNVFVGFGGQPYFKEFGPGNNTDVRMTVSYSDSGAANYRAYKQQWTATPATLPAVVAFPSSGNGYVSWNGATEVTSYGIYSGSTRKSLTMVASVNKTGFETQFPLPNGNKSGGFIRVGAFNGNTLLRKSAIVRVTNQA